MAPRRSVALALAVLAAIAGVACYLLFVGVFVSGRTVDARVIDLVESGGGSDRTCVPVLEYAVDGTTYRESPPTATSTCPFAIGESVKVYFWPGKPVPPSVMSASPFMPLAVPLMLLLVALFQAVRRPKLSERVAEAVAMSLHEAADGQLIKIRGRIDVAPDASPVTAPLSERPSVAVWTRIVRREPGSPDRKVQDETRRTAFVVTAEDGRALVNADTDVKLAVDADTRGDTERTPSPALEALLLQHGHAASEADSRAHHFVWYEGSFQAGEEVFVVGAVRRLGSDTIELVASAEGPVVLEHVDRDARKAAIPR